MPVALICTQADLEPELGHTLLWRAGVERHLAGRLEDARMMAVAARPDIVVVDRELPRSDKLVAALREDPTTRGLSIVVAARGDFDPSEVELLEAGANAILRLPAGPEWDERLPRLMDVPVRREARFTVHFDVEATAGAGDPEAALAINLSMSGMLLESPIPLAVGDEIQLRFQIPESKSTVATTARVVRVASPGQYGVEFREVDKGASGDLQAFVHAASERAAS
jgi:CheY-like chemotaxis protein